MSACALVTADDHDTQIPANQGQMTFSAYDKRMFLPFSGKLTLSVSLQTNVCQWHWQSTHTLFLGFACQFLICCGCDISLGWDKKRNHDNNVLGILVMIFLNNNLSWTSLFLLVIAKVMTRFYWSICLSTLKIFTK